MKTLNYLIPLLVVVFSILSQEVRCQVSINSDGSNADPSAMLEIKSADKGLLLPRIDFDNRPSTPRPGPGDLCNVERAHWKRDICIW